jgi:hypothetical protein
VPEKALRMSIRVVAWASGRTGSGRWSPAASDPVEVDDGDALRVPGIEATGIFSLKDQMAHVKADGKAQVGHDVLHPGEGIIEVFDGEGYS